jgi:hypothetical protein
MGSSTLSPHNFVLFRKESEQTVLPDFMPPPEALILFHRERVEHSLQDSFEMPLPPPDGCALTLEFQYGKYNAERVQIVA